MSVFRDLYRGQTRFDFVPIWRRSLAISLSLLLGSVVLLGVRGLDLSIDFEGGGVWEVPVPDSVGVADARDVVGVLNDARIQVVSSADGSRYIRVQSGSADLDRSDEVIAALADLGDVTADDVSVSLVGPTWGSAITEKALRALIFFFIAIAAYLTLRLEWRMAVGAVVAVIHDLGLTAGVYSLFAFEVSPATVIALLTILGYSLYDTVVVYDKVLENEKTPLANDMTHTQLINLSMNQVLMRSINTTLTTVLPVASMLVVGGYFLGGSSLRDFALALFIGLLLGTYSSIFVAAPLLVQLKERGAASDAAYKRRVRRASARLEAAAAAGSDDTAESDDTAAETAEDSGAGSPRALVGSGRIEPRPRKKKRR